MTQEDVAEKLGVTRQSETSPLTQISFIKLFDIFSLINRIVFFLFLTEDQKQGYIELTERYSVYGGKRHGK